MYTLGIDLHKRSSVWVLIDDDYKELWKENVVCHPDHITTAVKKLPVPPSEINVAIEPVCGWRWVSVVLEHAGMKVKIAHPKKVRLIAESTQKHDVGDARMLANLLRSGYFPEAHRVSEPIYCLRLLLRERAYLVGIRTSAKNRLHGIATTQGLHHIKGGNPLWKAGKAGILSGDNFILKELHALIEELDRRIAPFDTACVQEVTTHPVARILMTMPGVGVITALTVLAEVENFARFPSAKHLTSFAGLVPRQRSSGEKVRFGSITNQGSKILRTALVETAMRIRSTVPELHAFVERLTPICGAKKARIALARKMLALLWKMATTDTPYDAEKVCLSSSCTTNVSKLDTGSGA